MERQIGMPELLEFYAELAENNEKTWFDAHKSLYLEIKNYYENLGMEILDKMVRYDPELAGLGKRDIAWRIYQDQRFGNKPPYKSWMGLYFARGGKNSPYAGYYFHIEPSVNTYFLCSGLWREDKTIIKSVREDIMLDGAGFEKAACPGHGWSLDWDGALARPAAGWPADTIYSKYFRLKRLTLLLSF